MTIEKKLNKIQDKITSKSFLKAKGLGNEISFYIFDYDPQYEIMVRNQIEKTINKVRERYELNIKEFNLYKMLINMLEKEHLIEAIKEMEKNEGSQEVLNAIKIFAPPDVFVEQIKNDSNDTDIIFISGVGQIYPFIRSHTILNKLHTAIENKPLILLYPGRYDGQKLILFNKFKDDNYYRAFPLID
jgi:hypothetical protein